MRHTLRLLAVLLALPAALPAADVPRQKPNIVILYADDLGYGDVQCYNPERGKIPTPNIDKLAAQGMRFTDGHSSSGVCSPSRYTLLTGRYHWRSRLQQGIVNVWEPPLIAPDRLTIAGLARQHGYRTGCVGKWHLGWDWPITIEQLAHFRDLGGRTNGDRDAVVATAAQRATWRDVLGSCAATASTSSISTTGASAGGPPSWRQPDGSASPSSSTRSSRSTSPRPTCSRRASC